MGDSSIQAGHQEHAVPLGLRFRRDHAHDAREVAARAAQEERRPRQPRPHRDAPHRRWAQAAVPHHRLQAQQARHAGDGAATIEYDPNRSARIALVQYEDGEKRYILHPKGLDGRRHDRRRDRARTCASATRCRCARSRSAPTCTTSSSSPARAGRSAARPACRRRSSRRKASTSRSACASTEMRLVHGNCLATIGEVGNAEHELDVVGQGGQERWLGRVRRFAAKS